MIRFFEGIGVTYFTGMRKKLSRMINGFKPFNLGSVGYKIRIRPHKEH